MKKFILLLLILFTIGFLPLWIDFGNGLIYTDTMMQSIPFITELKRLFASGTPWWSWNTFFGDNFIGGYSFYHAASPLAWLTTLLPIHLIPLGIIIIAYLNALGSGIFSFLYFRRMKFSDTLATIGALLYVLSPFYIVNLKYLNFGDSFMLFPLLLFALENVISNRRHCYFWLAIVATAITFVNFYFSYPSFLCGFLYLCFRLYGLRSNRGWLTVLKASGAVVLGMLTASVILIPTLFHMVGCARAAASSSFYIPGIKETIASAIIDARRLLNPQIVDGFPSVFIATGYASTLGGIALFGFLPGALYCIRKRNWLAGLLLLMLVVYFTPLNGIFSGYTARYYTRWLYGMNMMLILATLYFLKERYRISRRALLIYIALAVGVLVLTAVIYLVPKRAATGKIILNLGEILEIILLIINLVALTLFVLKKSEIKYALPLVALCGTLNFVFAMFIYAHSLNCYGGYTEDTKDEVGAFNLYYSKDRLLEYNNDDFKFRTDYISKCPNISLLTNRPGIRNFHSVFNKNLTEFRAIPDSTVGSPSFHVNRNRESVSALSSVKEVYDFGSENPENAPYRYGLKLKTENSQFKTHEFEYYIPMGFSYDSYVDIDSIREFIPEKDDVDIPLLLLDNLAINKEDIPALSPYLTKGKIDTSITLDSVVPKRRSHTVIDFRGDTKGFTARTAFNKERVVFFSVPCDPGFTALVDGIPVRIYNVNFGFSAIVAPAGKHFIEFRYFTPGLILGCILTAIGIALLIILWFKEDNKSS